MAAVLQGLRVLDLSRCLAGSMTAMLLGDYGADVTKIEPPSGDPMRNHPGHLVWDRGKRSVVLDLTTTADVDTMYELARRSDVLIESFSPGRATELGVDYPTLSITNSRLIHCPITGYGRQGPWADRPGWDGLVQARSGMQSEQPAVGRDGPVFLHTPLPSYGAFFLASAAVNAALRVREQTGRGQWVETSLRQGAMLWTTMIWTRAETPTPPWCPGHKEGACPHH